MIFPAIGIVTCATASAEATPEANILIASIENFLSRLRFQFGRELMNRIEYSQANIIKACEQVEIRFGLQDATRRSRGKKPLPQEAKKFFADQFKFRFGEYRVNNL